MDFFVIAGFGSAAYLDGGTGSLILQAVIAGFLTAGYVVKTRWTQLKMVLKRTDGRDDHSER